MTLFLKEHFFVTGTAFKVFIQEFWKSFTCALWLPWRGLTKIGVSNSWAGQSKSFNPRAYQGQGHTPSSELMTDSTRLMFPENMSAVLTYFDTWMQAEAFSELAEAKRVSGRAQQERELAHQQSLEAEQLNTNRKTFVHFPAMTYDNLPVELMDRPQIGVLFDHSNNFTCEITCTIANRKQTKEKLLCFAWSGFRMAAYEAMKACEAADEDRKKALSSHSSLLFVKCLSRWAMFVLLPWSDFLLGSFWCWGRAGSSRGDGRSRESCTPTPRRLRSCSERWIVFAPGADDGRKGALLTS